MIQEQTLPHYKDDEFIGDLTSLQNMELRCNIAENKLEGYYLIFEDEKFVIDSKGDMSYKDGLYDQYFNFAKRIWKARKILW